MDACSGIVGSLLPECRAALTFGAGPLLPDLCAAPISGPGACRSRASHAMWVLLPPASCCGGGASRASTAAAAGDARLSLPLCGTSQNCKLPVLVPALSGRGSWWRHSLPPCGVCCTCSLLRLRLQGSSGGGGGGNGGGRRGQLFRHSLPRMGDTNTTTAFGNLNLKDIANSLEASSSRRASPPVPSPFAGAPAFNQDNQSSFQDTSSAGGELLQWACSCMPVPAPLLRCWPSIRPATAVDRTPLLCWRQASAMIEAKHGSPSDTSCIGGE